MPRKGPRRPWVSLAPFAAEAGEWSRLTGMRRAQGGTGRTAQRPCRPLLTTSHVCYEERRLSRRGGQGRVSGRLSESEERLGFVPNTSSFPVTHPFCVALWVGDKAD